MAVTVKIPTPLRNLTGDVAEVSSESTSLSALVEELEGSFPGMRERLVDEDGALRRFVNLSSTAKTSASSRALTPLSPQATKSPSSPPWPAAPSRLPRFSSRAQRSMSSQRATHMRRLLRKPPAYRRWCRPSFERSESRPGGRATPVGRSRNGGLPPKRDSGEGGWDLPRRRDRNSQRPRRQRP